MTTDSEKEIMTLKKQNKGLQESLIYAQDQADHYFMLYHQVLTERRKKTALCSDSYTESPEL